jgi:effector-binding domain-containing protein
MTTVSEVRIDERTEQPTIGIRAQVPMNSLSKHVTALFKELNGYVKQHSITPAGPPYVRYFVIDMNAEMDIEVGIPVTAPLPDDGRVRAGVIPAGRYASLIYTGSGYTGNKALLDWAKANDLRWDRWKDVKGDAFRSRYETYLTDPKTEPRKTKWQIEVAIKLADEPPA